MTKVQVQEKPAPVPTQLYAVEIYSADDDRLVHVVSHPVRAPSDRLAVWGIVQAYGFRIKDWRLQAVTAETHFPRPEAAA